MSGAECREHHAASLAMSVPDADLWPGSISFMTAELVPC